MPADGLLQGAMRRAPPGDTLQSAGWRRGGDCAAWGGTGQLTSLQVGRERGQLQREERGDPGSAERGRREG